MRFEEPAVDTANPADLAEQRAELDDTGLDDPGLDGPAPDDPLRRDLPLEADPADVAEQDALVPYDDER